MIRVIDWADCGIGEANNWKDQDKPSPRTFLGWMLQSTIFGGKCKKNFLIRAGCRLQCSMWQLSAAPYLVTLPYKGSWRQMKKELLDKDILQWSIWWMNNAPYLVILPYKGFDKYDSFNQRKAVQLMWPFWNPCVFIDSCILSLATRDCGTEASYYRYLDNTTGMFSFLSC